jgi:hypothetical protein
MVSPSTPRSPRLVDKLVPRRGAARRADASFSAQFQSSSPEKVVSDTEETFGEPMRSNNGKGKVKVQYGGRSNSTKGSTDGIRSVLKRVLTTAGRRNYEAHHCAPSHSFSSSPVYSRNEETAV